MRQVIVGTFLSLDGVMQASSGPEEDPTGGFRFGGWIVPYQSEETSAAAGELFDKPFDLLLGRPAMANPLNAAGALHEMAGKAQE